MQIELRHLQSFRCVAEELNFRRAAERVGVSQSSLSEQIQRLEDIVGGDLFDRSRRQITLTPLGERFLPDCESLLSHAKEVTERVKKFSAAAQNRLTIGYSPIADNPALQSAIEQFNLNRPDVELVMVERSPGTAYHALFEDRYDCVLLPWAEEHRLLKQQCIWQERVMACMPLTSPLADMRHLAFSDLDATPVILPPERHRGFKAFMQPFITSGIRPTIAARSVTAQTTLKLVRSHKAVGFIAENEMDLLPSDVTAKPIGSPPFSMPIFVAWRADVNHPGLASFIELLENRPSIASGLI